MTYQTTFSHLHFQLVRQLQCASHSLRQVVQLPVCLIVKLTVWSQKCASLKFANKI